MTANRTTLSVRPPPPIQLGDLRASVERHRASLLERLGAGEDGMALGRANARFLDACFATRFDVAAKAAAVPSSGLAVAAVGSFGRGAVALRSDADIVVVVRPRLIGSQQAAAFAEALLYPLWDATLAVGHQVVPYHAVKMSSVENRCPSRS